MIIRSKKPMERQKDEGTDDRTDRGEDEVTWHDARTRVKKGKEALITLETESGQFFPHLPASARE